MRITWEARVFGVLLLTGLTTLGLATQGVAQGGGGQVQGDPYNINPLKGPVDLGLTDPALIGAIDLHAHLEPTVPRRMTEGGLSIDYVAFAKLARLRGMRGFVQKSHSDMSSAVNAYMVRTHVAPELEVFGRMSMNLATGGINMASVAHFASIKGGWGRVIEMPTWDAEYRYVREGYATKEVRPWIAPLPPTGPKFVSVSRNGELLPEVKYLLEAMTKIQTADSNGRLSLATGHVSPEEDVLLAREARRLGLQIVAPHGTEMNETQMQEFVKLGGFIEIRNTSGRQKSAAAAAQRIRKFGAAAFVVSSDCGFMNYPLHTDCLALIAKGLRAQGITEQELDVLFKENPAKFLGLPPWQRMSR